MFHRHQRLYDAQQRERIWKGHEQPAASEVTVGIMGLGVIGAQAADTLSRVGFKVVGWSRTPKEIPGIETFAGPAGLDAFLGKTEILIVLLPLTPATGGILDLALFASSSATARPAALPHQCRARQVAGRCRHRRGAR